jgi:HEPN domain-containing protein
VAVYNYMAHGLRAHAAFLLHQAVERYFHAVLLVFTGYKPKTHDIELLANQTAPLHAALAGALPRAEGEDKRLFDLLRRAYIEARYSKSYRVTSEELGVLRERVLDLAVRVRQACAEKLASFCGPDAVGELPEAPSVQVVGDLPEAPALDDPKELEAWREALSALSYERGQPRGREDGRAEGRLEERARAIVDVLRRRGVTMSDAEADRILRCRDEAALARYWDRALTATSAAELLAN